MSKNYNKILRQDKTLLHHKFPTGDRYQTETNNTMNAEETYKMSKSRAMIVTQPSYWNTILGLEEDSEIGYKIVKEIKSYDQYKSEARREQLREDFFKEYTIEDQGIKKVSTAPHDLFEWFKLRLKENG